MVLETEDHLFSLNSLIGNELKRKGEKLYAAFVDFRIAFPPHCQQAEDDG